MYYTCFGFCLFLIPNGVSCAHDRYYETEWLMSKFGPYWKRLIYMRSNDENSISKVVIRLNFCVQRLNPSYTLSRDEGGQLG